MIAKITRGSNPGNIGAYLHGPGHANEHFYERNGGRFPGGVVVGGNVFVTGDADEKVWVKEMRAAMRTRPEITKPIWQASLRNTVGDRRLTDAEWAQAGQSFAESMGFAEHPWVMVRHADDHVHLVVCRVSDEGKVWHGRNDRRAAQSACTRLELEHGLQTAPRRREAGRGKRPVAVIREAQNKQAQVVAAYRAELEQIREFMKLEDPGYRGQFRAAGKHRDAPAPPVEQVRPWHLRSPAPDRGNDERGL
ncbi:MAG: mobilization protein [Kocuria rhizophila]|nr:MAG: mobilization protein [Kocuria rhizophila]